GKRLEHRLRRRTDLPARHRPYLRHPPTPRLVAPYPHNPESPHPTATPGQPGRPAHPPHHSAHTHQRSACRHPPRGSTLRATVPGEDKPWPVSPHASAPPQRSSQPPQSPSSSSSPSATKPWTAGAKPAPTTPTTGSPTSSSPSP